MKLVKFPYFSLIKHCKSNSLEAATIVVTMLVDVEELCTNTVTKMPRIKPEIGFDKKESFEKISPALFPAAK